MDAVAFVAVLPSSGWPENVTNWWKSLLSGWTHCMGIFCAFPKLSLQPGCLWVTRNSSPRKFPLAHLSQLQVSDLRKSYPYIFFSCMSPQQSSLSPSRHHFLNVTCPGYGMGGISFRAHHHHALLRHCRAIQVAPVRTLVAPANPEWRRQEVGIKPKPSLDTSVC